MDKKRKHVRVPYEKGVELLTDGRSLPARSINISNSGIQVATQAPGSDAEIQSISFSLPHDSDQIEIPCKIVRSDPAGPNKQEQFLGIEFSYQSESQMHLMENFIRDAMRSRISGEPASPEMRLIPRIPCRLTRVLTGRPGVAISSIDDISADGCLVSHTGTLDENENIRIEFFFPGDDRMIALSCKVTHVIHNSFGDLKRAGLSFDNMTEIDAARIRNFIMQAASSDAIRTIHERRSEVTVGHEYRINEASRISSLLESLKKGGDGLNALFGNSIYMHELRVLDVPAGLKIFVTSPLEQGGGFDLQKSDPAYFSFFMDGSSYYFTATLSECRSDRMTFLFPSLMYQSEKRSDKRKPLHDGIDISLSLEGPGQGRIQGRLVNISRRGFLCNVALRASQKDLLGFGRTVSYSLKKDLGLDAFGEIRHIREKETDHGKIMMEIGVETGIRRADFEFRRISQSLWDRAKTRKKGTKTTVKDGFNSEAVAYLDNSGRDLVALINCTTPNAESPVVILPPAFGKKKETLSPLVATLIENFRHAGKNLVILRYDGINRPGESYNDDMCPKRGYEMLHYRTSQGMSDLKATLNFACDNPLFKPISIVIVAFSMSALDARKLALKDTRIDYLINVMGVTCARSTFMNTTGGIDIIGNARMGLKNGISGVLGHILDLDMTANDLIENKYAYLADARHDMAQIAVPVSWIYGKHDKWIPEREIHDLMSVKAPAIREVFEIPTGHNLRSSEDAIKTFKIITGLIYKHLHRKNLKLRDPDRDAMVNLITYERERLISTERIDIKNYWKGYLIGEEGGGAGYDFYRNLDEFKEFLSLQGSLVDLRNGEVMADMGCGTGIFMERMLEDITSAGRDLSGARLVMVDLIEEALAKTRKKFERLERERGPLMPQRADFIQMNLEPNRLLPVKRFLDDPELGFDFLRNKIEGLKNRTIDRLISLHTPELEKIMRGAPITDSVLNYMSANLTGEDGEAVFDFNLAARLLKEVLTKEDLTDRLEDGESAEKYKRLRAKDVDFRSLNFGLKGNALYLGLGDCCFDKISASLLISYIFNPDEIFLEFHRLIKPGGKLLVSSMRQDSDVSVIFTNYISKLRALALDEKENEARNANLTAARAMLNEAAALFELEEDGYFRFYSGEELEDMMARAGFAHIQIRHSLGNPPQAVIATGIRV